MNTKKKHKNRPKPNPNVPKEDVKEEKVEDVLSKSDVKEEIPTVPTVPAVPTVPTVATAAAAEVITPVVEDVEAEDSPKKPKRKGKKKNKDKENVEETEKLPDVVQSDVLVVENPVTLEIESKEQEEKPTEAESVTPSARKKKNKKKTHDQKIPEKECLPVPVVETEVEIKKLDQEITDTVPPKAEETKLDTKSKKKNKKKKRNDSERSDNEEITCTSAFQQLLIEDDKPVADAESKKEDIKTEMDTIPTTIPESIVLEDIPKSDSETKEESLTVGKPLENVIEVPKEESKNKKKNKKDKKHPHEEIHKIDTLKLEKEIETDTKQKIELVEVSPVQKVKEPSPKPASGPDTEVKPEKEMLAPIECEIKREPSPKPKAKIAKPVEKKRKGQQETPAMEKDTESPTAIKEELLAQEQPATPVVVVESNIATADKPKEIKPVITEETHFEPQVETMNVPSKAPDKKRKKSPKPQKSKEKIETKEESATLEQIKTESPADLPKSAEKTDSAIENVTFTMCDESFTELQRSEKPETVSPTDELPPLINIDETNVSDNKSGKRKKKTPKFPMPAEEPEHKEVKQLITPEITQTEATKIDEKPKIERVSESLTQPDVEIQSIKTDESGSSCEATPDVHFIRSASHQTLDTNNNMVIQELTNVEDTKSNDPVTNPIIEGSGATPSKTPDMARKSGSKKSKEEPTYLKSKMMEVNQDMEELRLSIERSLAEFSAMEKSEQKAEEDYESHRVECEKTFAEVEVKKPAENTPEGNTPDDQEKKCSTEAPPVCPARKDNKGKGKSKKKGKQETPSAASSSTTTQSETTSSSKDKDKQEKQEKTEQKTESTEKGKQQSGSTDKKGKQTDDIEETSNVDTDNQTEITDDSNKLLSEQSFSDSLEQLDYAPIDKFEDAMTSSIDDVNKSFEMIVNENAKESQKILASNKPEINITGPVDEAESSKKENKKRDDKVNPVSQPKNFLGHTDIPVQSNRTDYKKEKNKTPNERQAKVKIKDAMDVEAKKQSKESQTDIKRIKKMVDLSEKETFSRVRNDDEEYVYKYSFRKVFLQSACHVCHKELVQRVPCSYCTLVFYCSGKHKDEDWAQHQALCFAVSTIVHLKDQKHVYADAQNITGQEYRLLRMQMIVSCEKVLKRRLVPWEQEAMLYPRMCGDVACREWRQGKLKDCEGCGQISYCADNPAHLPKSHQRWCKSYHLYSKLVGYQQTRGRLEPRLPTRVMTENKMAEKMNEVLAAMYEEKIDMNDIQYAALTQLATAPLTAAHCYQLCVNKLVNCNGLQKKTSFTIHVVGAELQFEADALNKWEVFFLHLRPEVEELRVVLISPVLNPGELPLELLGKIRLCDNCRQNKRRVVFSFQDKMNYSEYRASDDFVTPKLVCAFNPSIQRSSVYNGKDPWPITINCIIKQKIPFIITAYTLAELRKDIARIKDCSEVDFKVITEPVFNNFASLRPDRNFISDDEMPLLFKNYCVSVLCGC